jgi:transposase
MMSTEAKHPAITPIPVQLSEPEFTEFIFPHLSMPKRGPKCKIGYHHLFNLILWVLYTGMQWKCLPIPKGPTGKPLIHYTNVYRAFAKWADDGSLQQAFIASVAHLSDEKKLDVHIRLCRKFCLGGREGAVAPVWMGIRRPGRRTVQPQ